MLIATKGRLEESEEPECTGGVVELTLIDNMVLEGCCISRNRGTS